MKYHFLTAIACISSLPAGAQVITTVVGSGDAGYYGDGKPAIGAKLNGPFCIATGSNGELYIADRFNDRVRKVSAVGIITTVAGNGTAGFSGDGGPATDAALSDPNGVAADANGNVYIADRNNQRIRKVRPDGTISTIAGGGPAAFSGDGGPAIAASLFSPRGVAVDGLGNVYIADQGNHRIRRVDAAGIISTVAGSATAGFNGDNGPATDAALYNPYCVAVDGAGNLYIADVDNARIRKVSVGGIISTVAGNGSTGYSGDGVAATSASLNEPLSVAVDGAGNIFIADAWNFRVRKVDVGGYISTISGNGTSGYSGDGWLATNAQLNNPTSVALTQGGDLYISDYLNALVRRLYASAVTVNAYPNPSNGNFTITIPSTPNGEASLWVTDVAGRNVCTRKAETGKPVQVVLDIPAGIYQLVVVGDNTRTTEWIAIASR